jgi:hypothetical protein
VDEQDAIQQSSSFFNEQSTRFIIDAWAGSGCAISEGGRVGKVRRSGSRGDGVGGSCDQPSDDGYRHLAWGAGRIRPLIRGGFPVKGRANVRGRTWEEAGRQA